MGPEGLARERNPDMKFLNSSSEKAAKTEVQKAYIERINIMAEHGVDSVEGLLAEVSADEKAREFENQYGHPYSR